MTTEHFEMWSPTHLVTIGVIAIATFMLMLYGVRQRRDDRVFLGRRFGLFMLVFFIYEYAWRFCTFGFQACVEQQLLPLHFCAFMSLVCIVALWWQKSWACSLVYFGVLSASIQAIFTPALKDDFPSIAFFNFFISHTLLLMAALLLIGILKWRARRRDPLIALLIMDTYILLIHPVNLWMGSNYGFTTEGPAGTILSQLGPAPWYYLWLQVPLIILFYFMYLFVRKKA